MDLTDAKHCYMILKKGYLVPKLPTILGNIMRFFCDLFTLGRAPLYTFLHPLILMDDTVQLAFLAGDPPPERLSFPRNLLNAKVWRP